MIEVKPACADFLVEVGTEELPPKALRRLELAFAEAIRSGVDSAALQFADCTSYATPRRLAVRIDGLALKQPDQQVDKRGPPVNVAFDDDGQPTRAATAFAESCGVGVTDLERLATPKGEWLAFRGVAAGVAAADLLPGILNEALAALPVPRRMRWGEQQEAFVRPVHWLVMLLGDEVIETTIFGVNAGRQTSGHRFHAPAPITIGQPDQYAESLRTDGHVIASFEDRRARIESLVNEAAASLGATAVTDEALMDEVCALVEWPVTVTGSFDAEFLDLPDEVLVATLKVHQRYFPLRGDDGRLVANFIAISNIDSSSPEEVRRGNERVVRPRLADAAFFLAQDRRKTLEERRPDLANVVYQRGLGSLADKVARVTELAVAIAPVVGADVATTERAAMLCRSDLVTDMVGEFPELQGVIGAYYAANDGESPEVADALRELYLPGHATDVLPVSSAGQALALADRLDTLAGVFGLGKIPSGNRDPFGLRRAALGIVRILVERGIEVDLPAMYRRAVDLQPLADIDAEALVDALVAFTFRRMRAWYRDARVAGISGDEISAEMFESVLARAPVSPLDFHQRLLAVRDFSAMAEAASLAGANKRIANILRTADSSAAELDATRLVEPAELSLHAAVQAIVSAHEADRQARDYTAMLRRLAALRDPVDRFFDDVMVMTDDRQLQENRLALLDYLQTLFLDVADLSCLPAK